jgi:thymidylate synthase (FAD)
MKIIKPSYEILNKTEVGQALKLVEKAGRLCYKSEDRISEGSAGKFIGGIISRGHESVIEHISCSVRMICDRGVTHEIVRHRMASYSQESTRYCNYEKDKFGGEITFIEPYFWKNEPQRFEIWKKAMLDTERAYMDLITSGAKPEEARAVLPNSLKTEIIMTANMRSWRNFFDLRANAASHPQMRQIAIPLLLDFKNLFSPIFDDIDYDKNFSPDNYALTVSL